MASYPITVGTKVPAALLHPETGEVIVAPGTVLTEGHLKAVREQGLEAKLLECLLRFVPKDLNDFEIDIPPLPDLSGLLISVPRILIVDDAAFMRTVLRRILEGAGYNVTEASCGKEAIEAYMHTRPDMVTLDITMPDMDGISVLKEIRRHHPSARVVMASAMGQPDFLREAMAAGALDFMVKPFQPARVLDAIQGVLGHAPPLPSAV